MQKGPKNTLREVTRGEILRQCVEFYPRWVTRRSLLNLLDMAGYPTLDDDLDFHLEYLRDKGLIELQIEDQGVGQPRVISLVRITTAGVDLLDNRKKGDLGVRI